MDNFYIYKIKFFCDSLEPIEEMGIVYSTEATLNDAVDNIVKDYGEMDVVEISIKHLYEEGKYTISLPTIQNYLKELNNEN